MAVSTQVVYFTKDASGTTNATQDVSLNFTPKAIIVMSSGITGDNTFTDGYWAIYGFSDGTNMTCASSVSQDAAASGNTGRTFRDDSVFVRLNPTDGTTILSQATCTFSTNKVTFTWTTNDAVATRLVMYAFGGTDITNVKVDTIQMGTVTTGNYDYTGVGFNPSAGDSVLFLLESFCYNAPSGYNTAVVNASFTFGCAVSDSKQWCIANCNEDTTASMDTDRYFRNDRCIAALNPGATGVMEEAHFVSWITDGFRLYWDDNPYNDSNYFSYLVIKGGIWDVGTDTISTTGNKNHSVAVSSRTLRGLLTMVGTGADTAFMSAPTGTSQYMCGVTDGTTTAYITAGDINGAADAVCVSINDNNGRMFQSWTPNATAANSNVYYTAAFSSFGTNQFTITYANSATNTPVFAWVVVADAAAQGELKYGNITESPSVSVSETLGRVQTIIKPISDTPTVSVSETLARVQTILKSISDTPTISVSENLARGLVYPRPITNEQEVSVSAGTLDRIQYLIKLITNEPQVTIPTETIAKIASHPRPISDTPSVTVSETLEKILTDVRSITNEPEVSIPAETIAKSAIYPKPISDSPTITVSESLARIQSIIKLITNEPDVTISALATGNFLISKIINESPSITVSETLERIQYIIKLISDTPEVTISELLEGSIPVKSRSISEPSIGITPTTVERLATFARSITLTEEPLVSVNDTVARLLSYLRNITNEQDVTTSDVTSTLALIIRTLTEPSTNISEEITRIQSLIKLISETPPISTSDSVTAGMLLIVSLLESRIKWYYSLLTRKIPEGEA